eukprot:TRINITY_DN34327_c0_g1_i1.p1 TRINITY_DN34327_c0_g1~~TRINITY_DN34327_c0_g1_i1.p1  ORF type:complete len:596 (-),score=69.91 TRINITY_DN34327_c0_g1_i1:200-1987(-)
MRGIAEESDERRSASVPAELPNWTSMVSAFGPLGFEQISESELDIGDVIGKGSFKQVHCAKFRHRDVVILRHEAGDGGDESSEMRALRLLITGDAFAHRFIPQVFGICSSGNARTSATLVVQELAAFGSLKGALLSPETGPLITPAHMLRAAAQIARAMGFLETKHVVHADLSCRNVLLFSLSDDPDATSVKVSDFGLAVTLEPGADHTFHKQPQATRWCAPETVAHSQLSHLADVWSFGATTWEMFARGEQPWRCLKKRIDVAVQLKRLAARQTPGAAPSHSVAGACRIVPDCDLAEDFPCPDGCPEAAHHAMLACLHVHIAKRPAFAEVAIRFESLYRRPITVSSSRADKVCVTPSTLSCGASTPPRSVSPGPSCAAMAAVDTPPRPQESAANTAAGQTEGAEVDEEETEEQEEIPWCEMWRRPADAGCIADRAPHEQMHENFLWSQDAVDALGPDAALMVRMESEAARAKEMFLNDIASRQARTHSGNNVQEFSFGIAPTKRICSPLQRQSNDPPSRCCSVIRRQLCQGNFAYEAMAADASHKVTSNVWPNLIRNPGSGEVKACDLASFSTLLNKSCLPPPSSRRAFVVARP